MPADVSSTIDPTEGLTETYHLSLQQRRVWRLREEHRLPNAQVVLGIAGSLPETSLRAALDSVRARHEILRTTFHRVAGMTLPLQAVNDRREPEWRRQDLRSLSAPERARRAAQLAEGERHTPLDVELGPVLRALLL